MGEKQPFPAALDVDLAAVHATQADTRDRAQGGIPDERSQVRAMVGGRRTPAYSSLTAAVIPWPGKSADIAVPPIPIAQIAATARRSAASDAAAVDVVDDLLADQRAQPARAGSSEPQPV